MITSFARLPKVFHKAILEPDPFKKAFDVLKVIFNDSSGFKNPVSVEQIFEKVKQGNNKDKFSDLNDIKEELPNLLDKKHIKAVKVKRTQNLSYLPIAKNIYDSYLPCYLIQLDPVPIVLRRDYIMRLFMHKKDPYKMYPKKYSKFIDEIRFELSSILEFNREGIHFVNSGNPANSKEALAEKEMQEFHSDTAFYQNIDSLKNHLKKNNQVSSGTKPAPEIEDILNKVTLQSPQNYDLLDDDRYSFIMGKYADTPDYELDKQAEISIMKQKLKFDEQEYEQTSVALQNQKERDTSPLLHIYDVVDENEQDILHRHKINIEYKKMTHQDAYSQKSLDKLARMFSSSWAKIEEKSDNSQTTRLKDFDETSFDEMVKKDFGHILRNTDKL